MWLTLQSRLSHICTLDCKSKASREKNPEVQKAEFAKCQALHSPFKKQTNKEAQAFLAGDPCLFTSPFYPQHFLSQALLIQRLVHTLCSEAFMWLNMDSFFSKHPLYGTTTTTGWASASSTQDLRILGIWFYRHGILRTNHLQRPRHNCIVMRNNSYRKHNIILIKQTEKKML